MAPPAPTVPPFPLRLVETPPFEADLATLPRRGETARVETARGQASKAESIRILHADFRATVDVDPPEARLYRPGSDALGLLTTLRIATAARLPVAGGLLLHAAGLVTGDRALVFPGVSGAGKTTLAEASPWAVLSDELVAVVPAPQGGFLAAPTPFRSPSSRETADAAPLHALIGLAQEPAFRLTALDRGAAFRVLIANAAVPCATGPWKNALAAMAAISGHVPAFEMGWSPTAPPWALLAEAVGLDEKGAP